jgi:hypothetical protein
MNTEKKQKEEGLLVRRTNEDEHRLNLDDLSICVHPFSIPVIAWRRSRQGQALPLLYTFESAPVGYFVSSSSTSLVP